MNTQVASHEPRRAKTLIAGRVCVILFLLFSLLGLAVAVHLTEIHYFTHTDPSYHSICAINEKVNCETVAQSPYSVFAGLPISVWGILAYTFIGVLAFWGIISKNMNQSWPRGILFALSLSAFFASLTLAYISFFKIDSMCIFCMALYTINTLLFIVGTVMMLRSKLNPVKAFVADVKALLGKPHVATILVVLGAGSLASAELLVPAYWHHLGWEDLPEMPTGIDDEGNYWVGAKEPVVTIVEFSDYQCPFCRRAHKNMRSLVAKLAKDVRLVHRHQPLDNACNKDVTRTFHARACEFAKAAECAAKQGRFWDMNDALFSIQDTMTAANVKTGKLAIQLGLDKIDFDKCMKSEEAMEHIRKDMKEAQKRHIKGTPTFFINAQPYEGGIPENIVKNAIKAQKK